MKKLFTLLLAVLLIFSMCACGAAGDETPESSLELGFGRVSITPEKSVPLNGYGAAEDSMSDEVLSDIYVTCLAMKAGEQTALLFSQDLLCSTAVLTPTLRSELSSAVKVPSTSIFFAATGTYSAPNLKSTHENIEDYLIQYKAALVQAAQEAVADMAPATMYHTTTEATGMSFVHHYTMEDGTVEDGYYGFFDREITGHAAEADQTMRLVKVERKDKPAVLMINWQCRPDFVGLEDTTTVSADFVGYLRDKVEADTGMKTIYFTGAYGDLSATSLIESENHGLDVKGYGEKLAEYAEAALSDMTLMGGQTIGVYTINYGCAINHADEDRAEDAKKVVAERKENGAASADKLAKELGFRSVYHAASISSRASRAEKATFEVSALRLGDLGFLMSPCPLFSSIGDEYLEKIPTEFALLLCQANAAWNVLPSKAAFAYGGYEADVSYFAEGSGEKIASLLNEMLLMTTDD